MIDPRFSTITPGLQIQVNSSSFGPFKSCPRMYYYSVILGLEGEARSVHLVFGGLVHAGLAQYRMLRAKDIGHEEALEEVVEWALRATWNSKLKRPWVSGSSTKNRGTLIRTLVWYLDQYQEDNLKPLRLADGTLAIELAFSFDSGYVTQAGERVSFIGRLDQAVEMGRENYVLDTKTTEWGLDPAWFKKFTPDNQFSLYTIAGSIVLEKPISGLIVDGVQVGVGFSRFSRGLVPRSPAGLDEWLAESHWWLEQMETCALRGYWPMNDRSCGLFGGCDFREVCSMSPAARPEWLRKGGFRKRSEEGTGWEV